MKRKKKICKAKGCLKRFYPINSFNTACSPLCAIKVVNQKKEEKAKTQKKINKLKLEGIQPVSYWIKKCQVAFNKYIRARDYGNKCISSGREMNWHSIGGHVDCGHYRSIGSAPHLRFNMLNAHAQSVKDNRYLSGSAIDYRIRLIEKIGIESVERLEANNDRKNYTIEYLKRATRIFNKRASWYNKRLDRR